MPDYLKIIAGEANVKANEPMGLHTTFRAGGMAKYFVEPDGIGALSELIRYLNKEKEQYYILGNGSNVLVKDSGYDGVIIKIGHSFCDIKIKEQENGKYTVRAGAGAMLSKVSKLAAENKLTGMETLSGIPGTIGGAVAMNAGAYGGEIKDIIKSALIMDSEGKSFELSREELDLSYRHSVIQEKEYIVIEAEFELTKGNSEEIYSKMEEYANARKEKQPLNYPSAGSTFKRPEGHFAGKLIMEAGLRGYRVGSAMVSEKHCGFVINEGNATATDVLKVIEDVKAAVKEKFNVELEPEVKILG